MKEEKKRAKELEQEKKRELEEDLKRIDVYNQYDDETIQIDEEQVSTTNVLFFNVMASGGLYSFIGITQFTVLNNHLCALDITLRILITRYKFHVMNYISFLGVFVLVEIFSPSFNPGVIASELYPCCSTKKCLEYVL